MANPLQAGDPVGEPMGSVKEVAIEKEELVLDLRALDSADRYSVIAKYLVRNDGDTLKLELVFVTGWLMDGEVPSITLDGRDVPGRYADTFQLPEAWRMPTETPGISNKRPLEFEAEQEGGAFFTLILPPGQHEIHVEYRAVATDHSHDAPMKYWQIGYVLAPARDWASFGGLEARIIVPAGWNVAVEPEMTRSGDTLAGSWKELPADVLALTTQTPLPSGYGFASSGPPIIALVLALFLSVWGGMLTGRRLAVSRSSFAWAVLTGTGIAIFCTVMIVMVGLLAEVWSDNLLGYQGASGYGRLFSILFFDSTLIFLGSMILTILTAVLVRRRYSVNPDATDTV